MLEELNEIEMQFNSGNVRRICMRFGNLAKTIVGGSDDPLH
jgi:hypothetical protein